ncbi:MAG: glutamine synthetase family protein [Actinomycetota bacterium]|nr:glutamine synthetase family protein [Actinomycetota bacterium]
MADTWSQEQLVEATEDGSIDTVILAFTDHYGRLMGKRLDAEFFLEDPSGTHACDYLLTVDMEMEPLDGFAFSNWDRGYGDLHLTPDIHTLRPVPWLDRTALVICDPTTDDGVPIAVAPRSILRNQINRIEALNLRAMVASELEYFLYRTSYRDAAKTSYQELEPAGWYIEDYHLLQGARTEDLNGAFRRYLNEMAVPVESTKGEFGRGQHELNIRWCEALEMADRHVLLKQCVKEVADQKGAAATFMAKPHDSEAGSSSHLHLSLWSTDETVNLFPGTAEIAGLEVSDIFRHFLGGWLSHLHELMPCFAPTVNSYKRYQSQSWAPTGGAWSPDNRTAGFRIVGEGQSLRIECRVPGADVNPYLAYAAAIAAGLDGLETKIEPPPPLEGDAYKSDAQSLPTSLREAANVFGSSSFARQAFGSEMVDHYVHFWLSESTAFESAVTDWERKRYFEQI